MTFETFTAAQESIELTPSQLVYTADSADDSSTRLFLSMFDGPETSPVTAQTYDLSEINYKTCSACVLVGKECSGSEGCARYFYPRSGFMQVTKTPEQDGAFAAEFQDLILEEVDIADDFTSTPLPNAETQCMDGFSLDEDLTLQPGRCHPVVNEACTQVGEEITDFSLKNCDTNEPVSLSSLAAGKKALWVVGTAGWCPNCPTHVSGALEAEATNPDLKVVYALGADTNYEAATQSYCRRYASNYGDDIAGRFFYDHNGAKSYPTVMSNIWRYPRSDWTFDTPWDAVIDPRTMEVVFVANSGQPESLDEVLEDLLSRD